MRIRPHVTEIVALVAAVALAACAPADQEAETEAASEATAAAGMLDVTASDFEFDAPEQIPSGWTTIRFANEGEEEHFVLLWRIPDDKGVADYRQEVAARFESVWQQYDSGELEREEVMEELGAQLPDWFLSEVVPSGGVALTEPGETRQATVNLAPGTYVMECYVKTPQGTFHVNRGMLRELLVTAEANGAPRPEADVEITLSNYEVAAPDELSPGVHTIAVHVDENPEGFLMHDLNLVRLEEGTSADEVGAWMDWMDLQQFRSPAPGHSFGGVEHMLAGSTGYTTVELTAGRYIWVSEGYGSQGMTHEFIVQ